MFLIKTDHQLSARHRVSLRYNHQNFTGEGFENGGAQNAFEHTGASLVRTRSFNGSWTSVLGTRVLRARRDAQRLADALPQLSAEASHQNNGPSLALTLFLIEHAFESRRHAVPSIVTAI